MRVFATGGVSTQAEKEELEMELSKIIKAERQTVAGVNFRLCLEVDSEGGEGQDAVTIFIQAVVNRDLKGNWKLVSWAISECGESEDPEGR